MILSTERNRKGAKMNNTNEKKEDLLSGLYSIHEIVQDYINEIPDNDKFKLSWDWFCNELKMHIERSIDNAI